MGLGGRARRFPDLIPLPRVRLFPGACILFYITRYLFRTPSPAHLWLFVSAVLPGANMFVSKKEARTVTPEDLRPEVCQREHRNEDQDPEGHGPCERCECPRFEVLRNENLSGDRWPRRP